MKNSRWMPLRWASTSAMLMCLHWLCGLILCAALPSPALAQRLPDVHFRNINMDDGLPSYGVRSMVQDKDGFVWLGTDDGLCRYDGMRIRRFVNPEQAQDQYISAMVLTQEDIIVGTNGGVYRFEKRKETFSRLLPKAQRTVTSLTIDRDSTLWVATDGDGVHCLSLKSQRESHYVLGSEQTAKVNLVYADRDNQLWALCNAAPYMFRFNRASRSFVALTQPNASILFGATSMLQTTDGGFFIGSWGNGLLRMSRSGEMSRVIPAEGKNIPDAQTAALLERADGHLIVVCGQGLLDVNPHTGAWQHIEMTANPLAVNARFAYAAMIDQEQGLWCSTFYGGVNYISPVGSRFESFRPTEGGLQGNVVEHFAEDSQGRIWIGTDDGGLSCYDAAAGRFVDFPHRSEFASLNIHALYVDGDQLWIGTYSAGIYRMNLTTGSVRHFDMLDGLNDNSAYAFHRDSKGQLWVGTISSACLYHPATERFETLQRFEVICSDILTDTKGNVWFATQIRGLWRYTPATGKWTQFRAQSGEGALPSDEVSSLALDAENRLLVATGAGLCRMDERTEKFEPIALPHSSRRICSIVADGSELWISTVEGIVRLLDDGSTQLYNRFDGLVADQFLPNASMLASDGHIYFGALAGFSRFRPADITLNRRPPHAFITALSINNRATEVGSDLLPEALQYTRSLSLAHNQNNLTLQFTALSYCSPEKNLYSYMLEGFDSEWTMAGPSHTATYTNLPAGTYTFRVRASNNDGVWSTEEAQLEIVVHPPFWWSLPAKLFYILLAVAAIWLYTHLRLKRARREHRLEMRRLKQKQKADTEQQRLQFFTTIAHEIRTPVSLIIAPLDNVVQRLQGTPAGRTVESDLGIIGRNAHRLLELVNQLLDFSKVQQTGLPMRFRRQPLVPIMERVAERFIPSLQQKGITFDSQLPAQADLLVDVDREGLTKVVSNLMNNALKYARSSVRLSCSVADDESTFTIRVSDDGQGISPEEQRKIFQPFYQAENNKPGTGIGLTIVQSITQQHGGQASVESQPGSGTTFSITLPVRQANVSEEEDAPTPTPSAAEVNAEPSPSPLIAAEEAIGASTVLIVEDNDDMRSFLVSHFAANYTVLQAANGREALAQLARHASSVSLIVSDWMMPEMDGMELCRAVRADSTTSHIPFVLLTAKTDNLSKVEGMDTGADAYIEKPFSVQYLEACIRRMITARRELILRFSTQPNLPVSAIATSSVDNDLLQRLERAIEENITHPQLSVAFLAEQLNMSRSSLFSKIRALTEQTPNEMIQIIRLRHAARLLSEGHHRINEVSAAVGFNNASYFAKCFARQFGCKPTEYVGQQ